MGRKKKSLRGIRKNRNGFEVLWHDKEGSRRYRRFPLNTPESVMRDFRTAQRDTVAAQRIAGASVPGTFGDAVDAFLKTEHERRRSDFENVLRGHWVPIFGERVPQTISADEVFAALQGMRTTAEPATCNKRRSLLSAFWHRQLGAILNPVLARRNGKLIVPVFKTPQPTSRAIPLDVLKTVFSGMRATKTKARLMMIFYTGCRHSELKRVRAEHLHIETPHPKLGPYAEFQTGKGGIHRNVGLVGQGLEAAKFFRKLKAFGPFSNSSVWKSFRAAARRAGLTDDDLRESTRPNGKAQWRMRPYDLRHTCLTHVRQASDIATAQKMAGHASLRTTQRYAPTEDQHVIAAQQASPASSLELQAPAKAGGAVVGA